MKKYNIGLDIGTTSVGWAVVEEDTQKIIRKGNKRKALWGVRLFEPASTAEERRKFRSSRRRYDRRRQRIKLLQEEFKDEINKVDSNFFTKLRESKYNEKDLVNKSIVISADEKFKVKEYNDKYKTIYHLRERLINDSSKEDIRLVYLAIHHMIKYRGNFNQASDNFNVENLDIAQKLDDVFELLFNNVSSIGLVDNYGEYIDFNKLETIVLDEIKNDVKAELKKELSGVVSSSSFVSEFGKLIVGNKFTIKNLFALENIDNKLSISFDGTDFDDKLNDIIECFGDDIVYVLSGLKELYDMIFLKKIFKGSNNVSLSSLMVERYNQHKDDLRYLKELFKHDRKVYNKFFRNIDKTKKNSGYVCLYDMYIHNKCSFSDMKKELEKNILDLLAKLESSCELDSNSGTILKRIANEEFLPRITDPENGKYPYQLNKFELIKIIENQGQYYPFLLEKVNDVYKLVKLLEFKIPYYVGPLVSDKKSNFAWLERKIDGVAITPYNFNDVIDKEQTAEKFIKRMISHCTYLLAEYALPNNSILYSKFKVMNELKQIKVNGNKLTVEQQHKILEQLFMNSSGTITDSKFKKYLYSDSDFSMYEGNIEVTGYSGDNKFANNMQSYFDFFGDNGIFNESDYTIEDAEKIIEWITIFEDKDILESKVRNNYSNLSNEKVKKILSNKYSGWGSLSKKLLSTAYYIDKKTGIKKSILDLMYETNDNFMQIINDNEYNFQKMIKEYNFIIDTSKINYDSMVSILATSPSNKKGIWQALKVVDEIVKYMGYNPESIMIEMARGEDKKKSRKDDRVKYLLNLYQEAKQITNDYNQLMKELKDFEKKDKKIDTEKLYLYYLQEGKCLYCGNSIDVACLNGTDYEVDHILPRTLIKDNSWDNKALVCRCHNQEKGADLILPSKFRNNEKTKVLWERLRNNKLLSNKKMYRLTRKKYSDEDIQGFINRQIVETRQITKHVANILSNLYSDSKVVYLSADYTHDYRMKYELFKFRELNDYHHAHDAYLAAVLGEYREKYMKRNINFEFVKQMNDRLREIGKDKDLHYGYAINCFDKDVNDIVYNLSENMIDQRTGEVLFDVERFNKVVEDVLYRNDILVSRKTEIRSGQFFKQSIYSKGVGNVKLKENMSTDLYGGYSNVENSYLCLIKFNNKMKLIGIPQQIAVIEKCDDKVKYNYIKEHLKLNSIHDFEVVIEKVPFESLCNYNGHEVYVKGYSAAHRNCELCNAHQFRMSKEKLKKWKQLLYVLLIDQTKKESFKIENVEAIELINYLYSCSQEYPLFEKEIDKIKNGINLENCNFDELSKIVTEILKIYHCNSVNGNLKEFGLGDRIGRLSGCNITENKFKFQSITGIKEC